MPTCLQDGQRCDETGKGRSTQVRFFCCDAQGDGFASIQSIDEPHLCRYSIVVCSLFTCVDDTSTAKAPTFKRLLYPLTGVCFQRYALRACPCLGNIVGAGRGDCLPVLTPVAAMCW